MSHKIGIKRIAGQKLLTQIH